MHDLGLGIDHMDRVVKGGGKKAAGGSRLSDVPVPPSGGGGGQGLGHAPLSVGSMANMAEAGGRHGSGRRLEDTTIFEPVTADVKQPRWMRGEITRIAAARELAERGLVDGRFLIRTKESGSGRVLLALSYSYKKQVFHHILSRNRGAVWMLDATTLQFPDGHGRKCSLDEVVALLRLRKAAQLATALEQDANIAPSQPMGAGGAGGEAASAGGGGGEGALFAPPAIKALQFTGPPAGTKSRASLLDLGGLGIAPSPSEVGGGEGGAAVSAPKKEAYGSRGRPRSGWFGPQEVFDETEEASEDDHDNGDDDDDGGFGEGFEGFEGAGPNTRGAGGPRDDNDGEHSSRSSPHSSSTSPLVRRTSDFLGLPPPSPLREEKVYDHQTGRRRTGIPRIKLNEASDQDDVNAWVVTLGLTQYIKKFKKKKVDGVKLFEWSTNEKKLRKLVKQEDDFILLKRALRQAIAYAATVAPVFQRPTTVEFITINEGNASADEGGVGVRDARHRAPFRSAWQGGGGEGGVDGGGRSGVAGLGAALIHGANRARPMCSFGMGATSAADEFSTLARMKKTEEC
jgi:hypothetical protein